MNIWEVEQADAIEWLNRQPADSADLVFGSPPYMDARTYGIDASRDCQQWVDWMLDVTTAAVRVSKGLVLWVVAGVQRENCYWPGCEGLAWEWWKRGNRLWRPCVWWKVDDNEGGTGIPGSGGSVSGKRWLRADWEYVLCFKREGGIPYDNPTIMGHEPIYQEVGGQMSNRTQEGKRMNAGIGNIRKGISRKDRWKGKSGESGTNGRPMPKLVNPGNVIPIVVKARVGGGHIGSDLSHLSEAPFPEKLAQFFVRSFSPEGGLVMDCFSGSGTTAAVCRQWDRSFRGCDLRQSQVDLTKRRIAENHLPLCEPKE